MEDALARLCSLPKAGLLTVLILVLMEDALARSLPKAGLLTALQVLILVLMEDALARNVQQAAVLQKQHQS